LNAPKPLSERAAEWGRIPRSSAAFWLLGLLAAALRLRPYFANRSLWLDEAFIALNLIHRPLSGLSGRLVLHQAAPLGFLWVSKIVEMTLGPGERALRLLPLLCGLAAIPLFFHLARRLLHRQGAVVACAVFALSQPLIYYSSEVKQYSGDVLAALLVAWAASYLRERPGFPAAAVLAIAGVAALLFSHPAAFVLAMAGMALLFDLLRPRTIGLLAAVGLIWGAAFLTLYFVSLRALTHDVFFRRSFASLGAFPPFDPGGGAKWLIHQTLALFSDTAGISLAGVGLLCAALGILAWWRRAPGRVILWIGPIVLVVFAAALRLYPFAPRTTLFAVPGIALLIAEGTEEIRTRLRGAGGAPHIAILLLLFAQPALLAVRNLLQPRGHEELRPVLSRIEREHRPEDVVYVYYGAQYAMRYYLETRSLPFSGELARRAFVPETTMSPGSAWYPPVLRSVPPELFVGSPHRHDWAAYGHEVEPLRGQRRVWIIFSHIWVRDGVDEGQLILQDLDQMGRRIEAFEQTDAACYLYDLSAASTDSAPREGPEPLDVEFGSGPGRRLAEAAADEKRSGQLHRPAWCDRVPRSGQAVFQSHAPPPSEPKQEARKTGRGKLEVGLKSFSKTGGRRGGVSVPFEGEREAKVLRGDLAAPKSGPSTRGFELADVPIENGFAHPAADHRLP
jgi:Dolichyl-phosphate-mannose-protein mannosyltransferase